VNSTKTPILIQCGRVPGGHGFNWVKDSDEGLARLLMYHHEDPYGVKDSVIVRVAFDLASVEKAPVTVVGAWIEAVRHEIEAGRLGQIITKRIHSAALVAA
jgi:hypothetical protein